MWKYTSSVTNSSKHSHVKVEYSKKALLAEKLIRSMRTQRLLHYKFEIQILNSSDLEHSKAQISKFCYRKFLNSRMPLVPEHANLIFYWIPRILHFTYSLQITLGEAMRMKARLTIRGGRSDGDLPRFSNNDNTNSMIDTMPKLWNGTSVTLN
jgi:hypothetical protein